MTGNTLANVSSPVHVYDAANDIYVDENAGISKNGGTRVVLGNINMNDFRLTGGGRDAVASVVHRMNDVTLRRVRLVLGWVTVFGRVYHHAM